MSGDAGRGLAHLIGSVPLPSAAKVFRRLGDRLGPLLSRMPDGETGERRRWVYWQRTMLERHPAMEVDAATSRRARPTTASASSRGSATRCRPAWSWATISATAARPTSTW